MADRSHQDFFLQLIQVYKDLFSPSAAAIQEVQANQLSLQDLLKNVYIHMRVLVEKTGQRRAVDRVAE